MAAQSTITTAAGDELLECRCGRATPVLVNGRCGACSAGEPKVMLWQDDPEPWGIEFEAGADGNYWRNVWHVRRERGEGSQIATFEFEEHAIAFIRSCGPCGGEVAVDEPAPWPVVRSGWAPLGGVRP